MQMMRTLLLLPFVAACATASREAPPAMRAAPAADRNALIEAAEAFYKAKTPGEMQAAAEAAKKAGPDTAIRHELAAHLALFAADHEARFEHLHAALLDPENDQPALHLTMVDHMPLTLRERARFEALLETLSSAHPAPALRSYASHLLGDHRHEDGALAEAKRAREAAGARLRFALVGAWDNDQGKGFDTVHEPEGKIDIDARYEGTLVEIGWRTDVPTSPYGTDYNLGQLFSPGTWAVGYGLAAFEVPAAGEHHLRVTSSVPLKVWVNGELVYAERRVEAAIFDQFVIPVRLAKGVNRVLVKTAQNKGSWLMMARLTDADGAPVEVEQVAPDTPFDGRPIGAKPLDSVSLLARRLEPVPRGARQDYLMLAWASYLGLRNVAVELGDEFVSAYPSTLTGRYAFASESWNHGERGRTSDLLEGLAETAGETFPYLALQHARFLRQEGLTKKARDILQGIRDRDPNSPEVWLRLARQFENEGWQEDRCRVLEKALELRPGWVTAMFDLGECYDGLGFERRAVALYEEILETLPLQQTAISRLQAIALGNEELDRAEALAERLTEASPDQIWTWHRLAEARRRSGDDSGARAALTKASAIDPDAATPHRGLARIAYQAGDRKAAVEHWKAALTLDPDDEGLANRLTFLAPEKKSPWEKEVPDEEAIVQAVRLRTQIKPPKGADVIDLLDHEVSRFNSDGSSANFVTRVVHAVNASGRDALTQLGMPRGGRIRMLHAYAIGPDGQRTQVSSIRNRTARFRGLKVGSTVVLQYRHDARPVGYLAKHVARGWWFQGSSRFVVRSEWVVWADRGTEFHEWVNGTITRTEEEKEGHLRLSWSATDVPPILAEPGMPTAREALMNMILSTVPSWETFLEWEKALLSEAFRESAEVRALAAKLVEGAKTPEEKVKRIHRYLMEEIRYQQDYEDHIAGVKPHPSSVVVKRAYGDCKDKAVLFITLAKLVGLDAHFTILRTRPKGPVRMEVPMQQFNHAIVYVPKQEGIEEGRFYDPTADALDVDTLRADDPGVRALVLDTETLKHTWRNIPFQSPDHHRHSVTTRLQLDYSGGAKGTFEVEAVGSAGASIRKLARNEEKFRQGFQLYAARAFPGSTASEPKVLEVTDLEKPARVTVQVEAPSYGHREDQELRIQLPRVWSPEASFRLAKRRYPLVLGTPFLLEWSSEITLPKGSKIVRLPSSGAIDAECFRLERKATAKDGTILVKQRFVTKCERIPVDQYQVHRDRAEEMLRFYREEVVLDVPKLDKAKSASL